jgi:uncharacterized membrane protein (UPF0182 family)
MTHFGATATGITDPVFGKDLSFYLLELPLYQDLIGGVIFALLFMFAIWGAANLLSRGSQGSALRMVVHQGGSTRLVDLFEGARRIPNKAYPASTDSARRAMLLAALLCVVLALSRLLGRYHLVVDGHSKRSWPERRIATSISGYPPTV